MDKLLFVCGFPGGGTDLVKTVLNAHPSVYINGEMPLLHRLTEYGYTSTSVFRDLTEVGALQTHLRELDMWQTIENIDYDFRADFEVNEHLSLNTVLKTWFSRNPQQIWGNKTPQNTENMASLAALFPEAYFLIIVRDVRDVCLSWHKKWGKDMFWCASKWASRMMMGWQTAQTLPSNYCHFIRFEELLQNTEANCRQICNFLEVPYASQMLEHENHTQHFVAGKINYGQPIKADNVNKWQQQLPRRTIKRVEEIAFISMRHFRYTPTLAAKERPLSSWELQRGKLKDGTALLLKGNRAHEKNDFGQRLRHVLLLWQKQRLRNS